MLQTPTDRRASRRLRRSAFGVVGVVAITTGVLTGAPAAFAATDSTFAELSNEFAAGVDDVTVGQDITQTNGTLTLGPATGTTGRTTLHLNGKTLTVQAIELTSIQSGTPTGSTLTVTGRGTLNVAQTDSSLPAIEVSAGSVLTISSGTVNASVPSSSASAAIGGGPTAGIGPQNAGAITINGTAQVNANGGDRGAAIGGGYGGSASIDIDDSATVNASVNGGAAAVGAGYGSGSFRVALLHSASLTAKQTGTGATGAAIGGGASPTSQTAGSVSLGDEAQVTATSAGAGAAIGGGYHGDGGSITATGYSGINATGAQAAIGDGEHATGGGTSVTLSGQGVVVTAHGGTGSAGGAGIGGGSTAFGNDSLSVDGGATLTAASDNGPGIGGLGNTQSMGVSIGNATVTATGGSGGAAIGAGSGSSIGSNVSIAAGAVLTASAGSTSAIGGSTAARYGSLSNGGVLVIPAGASLAVPLGATATNSGTIRNSGTISAAGVLSNSGTIVNGGSVSGSVSGNDFRVVYDAQAGTGSTTQTVYAPTLDAGGFGVPTATPPSVGRFTSWNSAVDGSGGNLSRTASLSDLANGGSSDGSAQTLRLYALYQLNPVLPGSSALTQATVGTPYSASVAVTVGTAPISYDVTGVPAGLSFSDGVISGTPTTAGSFTVRVTATNGAGSTSATYAVAVADAPVAASTPSTAPVATSAPVAAPAPVPVAGVAAAPIALSVPSTATKTKRYLAGATATVRISDLQAGETYTITIAGRSVATGKASSGAAFTRSVTVPKSLGDGSQTVAVRGGSHAVAATSKILTASASKRLGVKPSAKKVKAKKKFTITVSKLYAGEPVTVVLVKGKHGTKAVGKASAKGAYKLTLKKGLAKGKYKVTVTGASTSRKATTTLTVR